MARVILALEIDEDEGFYNETSTGTVLGYLVPYGQKDGRVLYKLMDLEEEN